MNKPQQEAMTCRQERRELIADLKKGAPNEEHRLLWVDEVQRLNEEINRLVHIQEQQEYHAV